MNEKKVEAVIPPSSAFYVGDGFKVHNFIPSSRLLSRERMDPFIMLDYNAKCYFPATNRPKGVKAHPHRGFETVTLIYKGTLAHVDSCGNEGTIEPGDVQWMTAGAGVLHQEFHEENFSKTGGEIHMVQMWVNLPSKDKMTLPAYQDIHKNAMGKYPLEEDMGLVEIIAGRYKHVNGPAKTFSPMHVLNLHLKENGHAEFDFPEEYNTALLVLEGNVIVNRTAVAADHFVLLDNSGEKFYIQATSDALVLLFSGEPLNQPIVSQGPFVMNTHGELRQAFTDYNTGKFGFLRD